MSWLVSPLETSDGDWQMLVHAHILFSAGGGALVVLALLTHLRQASSEPLPQGMVWTVPLTLCWK